MEEERASEHEDLVTIWEAHRETTLTRVIALEEAVRAAAEGRLDDDTRRTARREAHTLAGSVALFGFVEASRLAGELEDAFAFAPDAADCARLADVLAALKREVMREVPRAG